MDKFEADTLYPLHFCFMSYIYVLFYATANPMASQFCTHLDQQIMFSFLCATFNPSIHRTTCKKTGYLNHPLDVAHLLQHFLGSHPTSWPLDSIFTYLLPNRQRRDC